MKDVCSVDGCDRENETRGLCRKHYDRARRYDDALKATWLPGRRGPKPKNRLCSEPSCVKPHKAKGLCNFHYAKTPEFKEHNKSKRGKKTDRCSIEGCKWIGYIPAKGMCPKHYERFKKHGAPGDAADHRKNKPKRLCSVPGCIKTHECHGLCVSHWQCTQEYRDRNRETSRKRNKRIRNTERGRERNRKKMKRAHLNLTDCYVRTLLNQSSPIKFTSDNCPPALIESARILIKIRRLLRG